MASEASREHSRKWRRVHVEDRKVYRRAWNQSRRKEVLAHYGNRCACCGEDTYEFLDIDHIAGYDRASGEPRAGGELLTWLKQNGFPPGFQVLCSNCNNAKGRHGICPHQK